MQDYEIIIQNLTEERDCAITMLADWVDAVENNGDSWDDWDEYYKDAAFRPGLIRDLIDAQRLKNRLLNEKE